MIILKLASLQDTQQSDREAVEPLCYDMYPYPYVMKFTQEITEPPPCVS